MVYDKVSEYVVHIVIRQYQCHKKHSFASQSMADCVTLFSDDCMASRMRSTAVSCGIYSQKVPLLFLLATQVANSSQC